jgi:hypothetical protein
LKQLLESDGMEGEMKNRICVWLDQSIIKSIARGLVVSSLFISTVPATQKLKPEEVIAKHVAAVGAEESRSSVTSRTLTGTCKFKVRAGQLGELDGRSVMASEATRSLLGMAFDFADYPHDRIGYDGKNLTAAFIKPGQRSILGNFLLTHSVPFREGLMGGALSAGWPLFNLPARGAKVEYAGTKKIDNRQMHVLRYSPKGGSDFQIKLYFDGETFRHMRTEYERVIPAQLGSGPDASASLRETRYKLEENFSDFKEVSGLTLPHTYRIQVRMDGQGGSREYEWTINLTEFRFNQKIDQESFNVEKS